MDSSLPPPEMAQQSTPRPANDTTSRAEPKQSKSRQPPPPNHRKLPRIADNHRITKRPLLHPPIAAPNTSSPTIPKTIYISARTPFIATVKRVRAYLSAIETRAAAPLSISHTPQHLLKSISAGVKNTAGRGEEVVIKATGKAIEAGLRQAVWWQGQDGIGVRVWTGSVGAVDDVVVRGEEGEGEGEGGTEVGSRVRRVSCLEVRIKLV